MSTTKKIIVEPGKYAFLTNKYIFQNYCTCFQSYCQMINGKIPVYINLYINLYINTLCLDSRGIPL